MIAISLIIYSLVLKISNLCFFVWILTGWCLVKLLLLIFKNSQAENHFQTGISWVTLVLTSKLQFKGHIFSSSPLMALFGLPSPNEMPSLSRRSTDCYEKESEEGGYWLQLFERF